MIIYKHKLIQMLIYFRHKSFSCRENNKFSLIIKSKVNLEFKSYII